MLSTSCCHVQLLLGALAATMGALVTLQLDDFPQRWLLADTAPACCKDLTIVVVAVTNIIIDGAEDIIICCHCYHHCGWC